MRKESYIAFDHDGLLTNSTTDKDRYRDVFLPLFEKAFAIPKEWTEEAYREAEEAIRANPADHPFVTADGFVAGPPADYILFNRSCALYTLAKRDTLYPETLPPPRAWGKTLTMLYKMAHETAGVTYQPETKAVLLDLFPSVAIISGTDDTFIRQQLFRLLSGSRISVWDIPIVGNAQKSHIDPTWCEAPESTTIEGYPHPVYLRKPKYHAALTSLPRSISVLVSDMHINDLSFPLLVYPDVTGILVPTEFTLPCEIAHVEQHPRGRVFGTLYEVRNHIEQLL